MVSDSKPNRAAFTPAILWFMLSFYLLTLPGAAFPKEDWFDKIQLDKWVHITLFGTLVLLFYRPFKTRWPQRSFMRTALFIALAAIAYGIAMEFVQKYFIPNRSFDVWDIVADGIGSILPFIFILRRMRKVS